MSELKHQILAKKKHFEPVPASELPELGVDLWLRRMSGSEFDAYCCARLEAKVKAETEGDSAYLSLKYLLLSTVVCDKSGQRVFDKPDELKEMDQIVLDRLAMRAGDLNGLTQDSREAIEKKLKTSSIGTTSDGNLTN